MSAKAINILEAKLLYDPVRPSLIYSLTQGSNRFFSSSLLPITDNFIKY